MKNSNVIIRCMRDSCCVVPLLFLACAILCGFEHCPRSMISTLSPASNWILAISLLKVLAIVTLLVMSVHIVYIQCVSKNVVGLVVSFLLTLVGVVVGYVVLLYNCKVIGRGLA